VFLRIRGQRHYLWRAVDQHGTVLDILVQGRRSARAAKRFFTKLLKGLRYVPRVLVTDKLKSYAAAKRQILPGVEHRQSRYLNNRAENSHQPTRRRERQMQRFKSVAQPCACSAAVNVTMPCCLLVGRLPSKSPWLNAIEPKWVHGKRAVVAPAHKLTAAQLKQRLCAYYQTPLLQPLAQQVA
jgi:hypothetical protein